MLTSAGTLLFAHPAYQLGPAFRRISSAPFEEVRTLNEVEERLSEVEVLAVTRLWRNEFLARAPKLRFIQAISAGTDQFDLELLKARGVRLASSQGVNERAVAEHAMSLVLALTRHLHLARDRQTARQWRGIISDSMTREIEVNGLTMLVVGLGRIGTRVAAIAKALGMRVVGVRRRPAEPGEAIDEVYPPARLNEAMSEADVAVLTCPHTPETDRLIGAAALAAMKPSAYLVNVARGRVVDQDALEATLKAGKIAGAGLDCFVDEPLPPDSPLWEMPNVIVTPHSAGETRRYEDGVVAILADNLDRLAQGESRLRNEIV